MLAVSVAVKVTLPVPHLFALWVTGDAQIALMIACADTALLGQMVPATA